MHVYARTQSYINQNSYIEDIPVCLLMLKLNALQTKCRGISDIFCLLAKGNNV